MGKTRVYTSKPEKYRYAVVATHIGYGRQSDAKEWKAHYGNWNPYFRKYKTMESAFQARDEWNKHCPGTAIVIHTTPIDQQ